jgi:nucleoside-diphosphate-sugar epimerase
MPNRAWDTTAWVADNRAIRAALGWEPRHDLTAGLRRLVDWFASDPALVRRYRAAIVPAAGDRRCG